MTPDWSKPDPDGVPVYAEGDRTCYHTEHALRWDGLYGRHFPGDVGGAGVWELCPEPLDCTNLRPHDAHDLCLGQVDQRVPRR